jgi:hypothetical protein
VWAHEGEVEVEGLVPVGPFDELHSPAADKAVHRVLLGEGVGPAFPGGVFEEGAELGELALSSQMLGVVVVVVQVLPVVDDLDELVEAVAADRFGVIAEVHADAVTVQVVVLADHRRVVAGLLKLPHEGAVPEIVADGSPLVPAHAVLRRQHARHDGQAGGLTQGGGAVGVGEQRSPAGQVHDVRRVFPQGVGTEMVREDQDDVRSLALYSLGHPAPPLSDPRGTREPENRA